MDEGTAAQIATELGRIADALEKVAEFSADMDRWLFDCGHESLAHELDHALSAHLIGLAGTKASRDAVRGLGRYYEERDGGDLPDPTMLRRYDAW